MVPATSANVGPGFDVLGIALTMYNEFGFEKSEKWEFEGFLQEYSNENNLVCVSMKKAYEYANVEDIKAKITAISLDVPNTRGLGSSATCIVAGIMGANYLMGNKLSKTDMLQIAAKIEGYPDNVTPAIFGGLTASFTSENEIKTVKYEVDESLNFLVCIPPFEMSTKEARKRLPHELSYEDIIYNTSRIVNLPFAFSNGNIELIKDILSDKMHEPYRFPMINGAEFVKKFAKDHNLPVYLSGSGSTICLIFKGELDYSELNELGWKLKILKNDKRGAIYEK